MCPFEQYLQFQEILNKAKLTCKALKLIIKQSLIILICLKSLIL